MENILDWLSFNEGYNNKIESLEQEIKSYLSQIFLELEDDGYDVDIEVKWIRTRLTPDRSLFEDLEGFKVKISGKDTEEDVIPSIETSISYMSSEGFSRYWIYLENFGVLNINELKSYLNLKKSLVYQPKRKLELNFHKNTIHRI